MIRRGLVGFPLVLLGLAALALFREPIGISLFYIALMSTVFFWIAQATSWNILSGYSGYFSFGQGAFVGVGVYTTAVLTSKHGWNFLLTIPAAAVLSTLLALGIGALAFRLGSFRGATFALLTLAVPFILSAVARLRREIDGGQGVLVPIPELPETLVYQEFLYLVTLLIAAIAVTTAYLIQHSRLGWALAAIRDNEDVAEALGVPTFRMKMLAIAITGAIGGAGGSAWALQFGFVQVEVVFGLTVPLFVIVMSVLGGRTHWMGPVIGAVVIVMLQDRLAGGVFESWRFIIFGGLLALTVIFAPEGLWVRLRARPWAAAGAGIGAFIALWLLEPAGNLLDRVAISVLVVAVVVFWPRGWTVPAIRRRRSADAAQPEPAQPAHPPESVPSEPVTLGIAPSEPVSSDAASPDSRPQDAAPPERPSTSGSPEPARASAAQPAPVDASADGSDRSVVVKCEDVVRHFNGVRAVDGVDLEIRSGELVGLIGPNGSGKTTLVNVVAGVIPAASGTVHIAGHDTTKMAPHKVSHAGVARTYQIPRPFESMTLLDNVALAVMFGREPHGRAEARRLAQEHLDFVGLGHLGTARPDDINLHQRQLLEMARALATRPKLLLLDETLAGLNPAEIDNAAAVVRRIHASGVTIVIVEHILRVVNQLAERIVVLNRGRVIADGDPRTVMNDPTVVEVYLGKRGRKKPGADKPRVEEAGHA